MMRKALTVLAPLALGLSLSACQQKDKAPEAPASAAPDAKPGVAVADARLVLPAVKGNPGVAYFTLANSDTKAVALAAVSVDGVGKAEMHQTVGGKMGPVDRVDIDPNASVELRDHLFVAHFGEGTVLKVTPDGQTVDKIAGPVGEALVMTAFGLGVAIPAVLGYNLLGRRIGQIESELEGFAHDLRGLLAGKD